MAEASLRHHVDTLLEKYAKDILGDEPPSASASADEFTAWRTGTRERAGTLIGEIRRDDEPHRKEIAHLPDRERAWSQDAAIKAANRGQKRTR